MARKAVNFALPKTVEAVRRSLGRRPRVRNTLRSADATHQSADALIKTQYGLTEEAYRDYGVAKGILPAHLADKDVFKLDQASVYTELDSCSVRNIASIAQIKPEKLLETLPEGVCGDVLKDIALLPEGEPLGIVNRKITMEIISQLKQYGETSHNGFIDARGFLLDGKRGVGKSYVLNHVALWARKNGWMVIVEPSPSKYAKEIGSIKRSNAGVYIQSEFAVKFLETLMLGNRDKLEQIQVDLKHYGKISLDGNHIKHTKRMFNSVIEQAVNEELEIFMEEEGADALECEKERLKLWHSYRQQFKIPVLTDVLASPATLAQIAAFGIENETYANQAVYEIFDQLKHQTKFPLLVVVDEYNECFPVSEYLSIKYENTKFNGWIPSYHLAMPKLFSKFDGEEYRKGVKLVATTWTRSKRRNYKPELLGIMPHEVRTVRAFTPKEYANLVYHLQRTQTIYNFPSDKTMYFYMLTGNPIKNNVKYYRRKWFRKQKVAVEALLAFSQSQNEELMFHGFLRSRPLRWVGCERLTYDGDGRCPYRNVDDGNDRMTIGHAYDRHVDDAHVNRLYWVNESDDNDGSREGCHADNDGNGQCHRSLAKMNVNRSACWSGFGDGGDGDVGNHGVNCYDDDDDHGARNCGSSAAAD
ncbi:ribosomal protein death-associated 3, putative [Babesia ovis]|uniref:Small ribosomal subunit protein mS29 n=1 Tax=Babesia ovis TaxID=5869 RepID=A0A9W5TEF4_BABOV|nr:ribosomal protein death-associated 3, putative [Babesia ovis]